MCLQIFVKEKSRWYLTFIPDAKAFTDAPELLMVLFKQRRRWMNGSLFAAVRVLKNMREMVGLGTSTKHPLYRRIGVFILMLYYLLNQIWTFFIVGSFYLAVKVFFQSYFKSLTTEGHIFYGVDSSYKEFFDDGGPFATYLAIFWGGMCGVAIVVSLAAPLPRAMSYLKLMGGLFSITNTIAYYGIFK